ncbi:MAG: sigma-70 family RNA polymerase sigma factor [Gemmatimonadetes bacterium]|nr:sigma-70 family RNA polymerase sigma factor [Gemmatimonadota bacterium]
MVPPLGRRRWPAHDARLASRPARTSRSAAAALSCSAVRSAVLQRCPAALSCSAVLWTAPPIHPLSNPRSSPARSAPLTSIDLRDALAQSHRQAFAWAVRCCQGDQGEAEDVLHTAYCKVLDGKARFEGRSSFTTWFFGVVRRTAQEQARWRWLRVARLERWWQDASVDGKGEDEVEADADDRVAGLQAALPRLSPRQQEVLHLVFYQGLTIQESAEVLGLPVGTARTHYERGKARLRHLLLDEELS